MVKTQRADGTATSEDSRGNVPSEEAQGEEGNLFHLDMYAKACYNYLDTMLGSHQ